VEATLNRITDAQVARSPAPADSDALPESTRKYLTFLLADEEYGLNILHVREIIGIMDITAVPQTSSFVRGVFNLRGKVIPVIDLRLKFGLPPTVYNEHTCIIVVDADAWSGATGIIVDAVCEVHDISESAVSPPPEMGACVNSTFILGMGKVGDSVKILLDIEKVLTDQMFVQAAAATTS